MDKYEVEEVCDVKKWIAFVLSLIFVLALTGCNNRSMNYIIENEPSIAGIVEEVRNNDIIIYIETDGYPNGARCEVSLDVENTDSYTNVSVGDEVVVYYNGEIAETSPLQIDKVYAITLRTPAERSDGNTVLTGCSEGEIEQPQLMYGDRIYYYMATGFEGEVPEGYSYVGEVKNVDNKNHPTENFSGCRLTEGQKIFADTKIDSRIYIEYEREGGYAEFTVSDRKTGDSAVYKEQLTMEIVKKLAAKGETLSWSDFEPYAGEEVGFGLYIMHYGIDNEYYILIGGSYMEEPPMYVRLVAAKNRDHYIDIRTENIDDFINEVSAAESETNISYGNSELYSEEDMNAAIKLIEEEFYTWEGCQLHSITYSSDSECNAENIAWMNELAKANGLADNFTQCIMFKSDFHSPKIDSGAWNPDEEYTDWQWWLAREEEGNWKLLTWGY